MLFAAIDIGSNAVRLYLANVFFPQELPVVEKYSLIRVPLRLGEDVFISGKISEERIAALIKTLQAFKMLIEVHNPLGYIACATSAMREAENRNDILKRIYFEADIDVKIIDGIEEARIICASNNISTTQKFDLSMYVDVGGGSTEISILRNHEIVATNTFKIGTLRILRGADKAEEWEKLKYWLFNFENNFGNIFVIGSGGSINKLGKLYGKSSDRMLSLTQMQRGYRQIKNMTMKERIEEMGLRPDRADVIVPAAEVFIMIAKTIKCNNIYIPRIGLSDGLVYNLYNSYVQRDITSSANEKVLSRKQLVVLN
ncbi:MAG: Ppx/GppA family phosphatase [Bacteroidales bacterium]|jgi:exopolyphosphatase/guanosine-5'-triphosphate,3'-diphosphate pyrophosphatase